MLWEALFAAYRVLSFDTETDGHDALRNVVAAPNNHQREITGGNCAAANLRALTKT